MKYVSQSKEEVIYTKELIKESVPTKIEQNSLAVKNHTCRRSKCLNKTKTKFYAFSRVLRQLLHKMIGNR